MAGRVCRSTTGIPNEHPVSRGEAGEGPSILGKPPWTAGGGPSASRGDGRRPARSSSRGGPSRGGPRPVGRCREGVRRNSAPDCRGSSGASSRAAIISGRPDPGLWGFEIEQAVAHFGREIQRPGQAPAIVADRAPFARDTLRRCSARPRPTPRGGRSFHLPGEHRGHGLETIIDRAAEQGIEPKTAVPRGRKSTPPRPGRRGSGKTRAGFSARAGSARPAPARR